MSSADAARAYLRERFPLRVFVPLALLLASPGAAAGGRPFAWGAAGAVTVAMLLAVLAFRIVDDLADRTHDAVATPGRITVRTPSARPFAALALVSGLATLVLLAAAGDAHERIGFVGLAALLLAAWYPLRERLGGSRLLNAHVVLLKYPLLVLAAAGAPLEQPVVACAAGLLYVTLLIHELRDDRDLRGTPRALLLAHGVTLLILGALLYRAATLPPVST